MHSLMHAVHLQVSMGKLFVDMHRTETLLLLDTQCHFYEGRDGMAELVTASLL